MEFRKMVMMTLYVRQQKRHRCIEQSFGHCGRGWGWDDLGEWHWNRYIIICETNLQSRLQDTGCLGLVNWDDPEGWYGEGDGRGIQDWENTCTPVEDSCWCMAKPTQYCKVDSLQFKKYIYIKKKRKSKTLSLLSSVFLCSRMSSLQSCF